MFDKRAPARHFGFSRADLSSPTLVRLRLSPSSCSPPPRSPERVCWCPPQVPMLLPSGFPLLARGLSGQRAALIGRSPASAGGTGVVSWSPPSPPLQEDPSAHLSEPQEPPSLEKTGVSGGQGGAACSNGTHIKTETLEDA